MAYTVFISYLLESTSGYSTGIHCNYIQAIPMDTDNPYIMEVNMNFSNEEEFKFLNSNPASGTGYTANKIYALLQLVVTNPTGATVPIASDWKKVDITDQIKTDGTPLTPAELVSVAYTISLYDYDNPSIFAPYDLTYINYPSADELCFGSELYFLGNVETDIHADVYVTDLSILLPLDQFNSSTNKTWDSSRDTKVAITEIGIYDDSTPKNLVAIGKLNSPIFKDSTIARTLLFALDF